MKVREFLDKLGMSSNAKVIVQDASRDEIKEWRMFYDAMRYNNYVKYDKDGTKVDVGALKLAHFSVRDNEIWIYAD